MISEIFTLVSEYFRPCFSRLAAFQWFTIIILGLLVRMDHHGVTSIFRWLNLSPKRYTACLAFFRAQSWQLDTILKAWTRLVLAHAPLVRIDQRYVLIGDGIKISKEAEKMPAVKRLHQQSDNSAKAPYINGHHFGVVGILAGCLKKNGLHSPSGRDP